MLQNFYPHLLAFHGLLRWVVLAAAVAAIFVAISGWKGKRPVNGMLLRFGIIFILAMYLEFLLGLLLYFGASPLTKMAFQNMAAAMKDHELRFFAVDHTAYMFVALILAQVGVALSRKGKTDLAKYRGAAICYSLSLLLMLAGIPWWRPLLRLGS
jgi:hypothetical protein